MSRVPTSSNSDASVNGNWKIAQLEQWLSGFDEKEAQKAMQQKQERARTTSSHKKEDDDEVEFILSKRPREQQKSAPLVKPPALDNSALIPSCAFCEHSHQVKKIRYHSAFDPKKEPGSYCLMGPMQDNKPTECSSSKREKSPEPARSHQPKDGTPYYEMPHTSVTLDKRFTSFLSESS